MKKRGFLAYKAIILGIVSIILIVGFINIGKSYGSQTAFYKLALAKDIALTIDLIYGLPGDIIYIYPNELSDYDIEIAGNRISVYEHKLGSQDPTAGSYNFAAIGTDALNAQLKGKKYIRLEKSGSKITATG